MNPWRFWFELSATIALGLVVLVLLGPLVAAIFGVLALGRFHQHRDHHGGCHRRHHH